MWLFKQKNQDIFFKDNRMIYSSYYTNTNSWALTNVYISTILSRSDGAIIPNFFQLFCQGAL